MKGCELCPSNEDVWLEAARLQVGSQAAASGQPGVTDASTVHLRSGSEALPGGCRLAAG